MFIAHLTLFHGYHGHSCGASAYLDRLQSPLSPSFLFHSRRCSAIFIGPHPSPELAVLDSSAFFDQLNLFLLPSGLHLSRCRTCTTEPRISGRGCCCYSITSSSQWEPPFPSSIFHLHTPSTCPCDPTPASSHHPTLFLRKHPNTELYTSILPPDAPCMLIIYNDWLLLRSIIPLRFL